MLIEVLIACTYFLQQILILRLKDLFLHHILLFQLLILRLQLTDFVLTVLNLFRKSPGEVYKLLGDHLVLLHDLGLLFR